MQAVVDRPAVGKWYPGKRWQSKCRTTQAQVTSILMIKENNRHSVKGLKKYKQEKIGVQGS